MVSSTPRLHFTPGKDPVPILQEAGWAAGPVWTGGKSRPHRDFFLTRLFYFVLHEFYTDVNIVLCVQGVRYYSILLSYVLSLPSESYGNWGGGCAILRIRSRTVQPVVSRCTDRANRPNACKTYHKINVYINIFLKMNPCFRIT